MIRIGVFSVASVWVSIAFASTVHAQPGKWELWKKETLVHVLETSGLSRQAEPVELEMRFEGISKDHLDAALRIVEADTEQEVPAQINIVSLDKTDVAGQLTLLANLKSKTTSTFRVCYDNPKASQPVYQTDLTIAPVTGFEKIDPPRPFGLTVRNEHVRAGFHPRSGQLGKLAFLKGT